MRKTTLLKLKTTFVIVLATLSLTAFGQATLPFSYDGGNPTGITGLTASGLGSYTSSPKMKFDDTGDYLVLNFNSSPNTLTFNIKWNAPNNSISRFQGDFELLESTDGTTYTRIQLYSTTEGNPIAPGATISETFSNFATTTRYIKWVYTSKVATTGGNIALGNIVLTAVPTTGVNNPSASNNKVYAAKGNLMVDTDADQTVEVYSATGQKLLTQPVSAGLNTISVQTKGLVFVKLGQSVSKVIL